MTRYYYPIPLLANFLHQLQWYLFIHHTFRRKYALWGTCLAELVLFAVYILGCSLMTYMSVARTLFMPALYIVAFTLLFEGGWQRIACAMAGLWMTAIATEGLSILFVFVPGSLAGHMTDQSVSAQLQLGAAMVPTSAVLVWLLYYLFNRHKHAISVRQWLLCALFLFCQGVILFCFMQELTSDPDPQRRRSMIYIAVSCLTMDIFLVQYMVSSARRERLQQENRRLAEQIDAQLQRYTSITAEYDAVRRMRHDIAKHLSAMERLLRAGQQSQAERYIAELKDRQYRAASQLCENPVADALLCGYAQRAEQMDIQLDLQLQLPAQTGIENTDLICALGNLLDNALDACAGQRGSVVRLRGAVLKGYLTLQLENPVAIQEEKPRHVPELDRGVGTQILHHIAGKYQGSYTAQEAQGLFRARLTLKTKEA